MPLATDTAPGPHRVRHESKFEVPLASVIRVEAMLEHLCTPDPTFQTNVIKSLYFDTPRLDLMRQKEASEFLKRKVRIRWYVDPRTGETGPRAFLETKTKQGARGGKERSALAMPAEEFDRDPLAAARALSDDVRDPLRGLEPACVIRYQRRRYIELSTGFRVALDTEIRAESLNPSLLHGRRAARPTCAILEIKGSGARALPPVLAVLHDWGVRKAAFSKFVACLDDTYPLETEPL